MGGGRSVVICLRWHDLKILREPPHVWTGLKDWSLRDILRNIVRRAAVSHRELRVAQKPIERVISSWSCEGNSHGAFFELMTLGEPFFLNQSGARNRAVVVHNPTVSGPALTVTIPFSSPFDRLINLNRCFAIARLPPLR